MRSAGTLSIHEVRGGRRGVSDAPLPPDIESSSDEYARRFSGRIGAWFLDCQARGVLHLLSPLGPCRILEVGGGHAQLTPALLEAGHTVTVQGSTPECAIRVRRLFPEKRVPFVVCPLDRFPLEDGAFDLVVSLRMMAHVDNPRRFLAECARVATRGVLVDYPSRRSVNFLSDALFQFKKGLEKDTRVYRTFDDAEVRRDVKSLGLVPAGEVRQFFWPMALHRAHKNPAIAQALEGPARALGLAGQFGSPVLGYFKR